MYAPHSAGRRQSQYAGAYTRVLVFTIPYVRGLQVDEIAALMVWDPTTKFQLDLKAWTIQAVRGT